MVIDHHPMPLGVLYVSTDGWRGSLCTMPVEDCSFQDLTASLEWRCATFANKSQQSVGRKWLRNKALAEQA